MAPAHDCLTVDEILSHFSSRKAMAQEKYREFVESGVDLPSLWDDLTAQTLLGVEGFAEAFRPLLAAKQRIQEIPRGQRFADRPSLEKLFEHYRSKRSRDQLIVKAVTRYGYSQIELARLLRLHYSTISRILAEGRDDQD